MPKAKLETTTLKRRAPARRSNTVDAVAKKMLVLMHRVDLKRDAELRRGIERVIRREPDFAGCDHDKILAKIFRVGERRGLLMPQAERRRAKKAMQNG